MSTEASSGESVRRGATSLGDQWQFLMAAGVLLAALGLIAIVYPFVTSVFVTTMIGAVLVVGAVVHFAQAFAGRGWQGFAVQVLLGLLYLVVGLSLLVEPVSGVVTLTLLLVGFFVADGVLEILMGIRLRGERSWVWPVVSGVVSLALAGLIWAQWPTSAIWAVGLLFGVGLLTSGVQMVLVAWGGRRALEEAAAAPAAGAGET